MQARSAAKILSDTSAILSDTSAAESFTLPAFAKINLGLRVLGRRADGYHELRTIFHTITLRDELTFTPRTDAHVELTCAAPDIPTDETNLVLRAARALRERYDVKRGAQVALAKRIPVGGGLGGGSADAAVALIGLARLWQIDTSGAELARIGAHLGADVPFFFTGGAALGTGRGTEITPLADAPRTPLVVITPGVKISTSDAYKALSAPALTKDYRAVKLPISCTEADAARALQEELRNDFEPVVFRLEPAIERARDALLRVGAKHAALSGSGASVFGIFDSEQGQARALDGLGGEAGWRVFASTTLARAEYRAAFGACAGLLA